MTLSYRGDSFSRIKPANLERINKAEKSGKIKVILNSNVKEIKENKVILLMNNQIEKEIDNDLVYIFAGGELPSKFLQKVGVRITKKFRFSFRKKK